MKYDNKEQAVEHVDNIDKHANNNDNEHREEPKTLSVGKIDNLMKKEESPLIVNTGIGPGEHPDLTDGSDIDAASS
jgi:hypothetical protein